MSIGVRVTNAIGRMDESDWEDALFCICAAIGATAKKELGGGGRSAYKTFIHDNLGLITDIAFRGKKILNLHLGYDHPEIKKREDGVCSIQDILYHAVRCGLYHDSKLPDDLVFTDEGQIRGERGKLVLPASLIYGFIIAVIVSPVNSEEVALKSNILNLYGLPIPIDKLWGKRNELLWLLEILPEAIRLQAEVPAESTTAEI